MRFLSLLVGAAAASLLVACSSPENDDASVEAAPAAARAACSSAYWSWVLHDLRPRLARPIDEVSEAQLLAIVAAHPASEDGPHAYSTCWQPLFAESFFAPAAQHFHQAHVTFVDRSSADFGSYARYRENVAMTPELRRNAKALLALRPAKMTPTDVGPWATAYESLLNEAVEPVGMPGPQQYEGVVEAEWVVDDAEGEYLGVAEAARAEPSSDGVYGEWMSTFARWTFGPPSLSRSFVFNLPFEPGAESEAYGLSGVVLDGQSAVIPAHVEAFLSRLAATRPGALGAQDSAAWMSHYNGRAIRALADLAQAEPAVTSTDRLALDVLERVKPAQLRGVSTYETWLDLLVLADGYDASWSGRFVALEPCVDASDLESAKQTFAAKSAGVTAVAVKPPRACAE